MPTKDKKIRIDVLTRYFYPVVAGIETNIMNVYAYLAENGWDVTIHTSNNIPTQSPSLAAYDSVRGLSVKRLPWRWYGIVPEINWAETDAVALHNFDIFPHSWILAYVFIRRILGLKTPKVFLVPHGGYTPGWWTFPTSQRILKQLYQRFLGTWLINHVVDAHRSVSEWESAETIKSGVRSDLVTTIQNGLEKEAFTDVERLASDEIRKTVRTLGAYIVQVGRVHPIKNQITTIKALPLIDGGVKFAIAGPVTDEPYKVELERLIDELGLKERVVFLGTVAGIDKYYLLKHSLANVHMASWESYCNAMHESMSQGCICIIARGTASEELIKDGINGYAVGVEDYQAVAEKVNFVLTNRESDEFRTMRARNIDFTREHSWENIARRVETLYLSVWSKSNNQR